MTGLARKNAAVMIAMTRASMPGIRTACCMAVAKADPTAESTVPLSDTGTEPRLPPPVAAAAIFPAVGAGTPREVRAPGRSAANPLVSTVPRMAAPRALPTWRDMLTAPLAIPPW